MNRFSYHQMTVALFLIGLSSASAEINKDFLDTDYSVAIGQTLKIKQQLVIKFKAVLEDSRCPVNVVCIWAGNAKVEFDVQDIDGQNKTVTLNTEDQPKEINLKAHKLKLISLTPPRIDGVSLRHKDYSATFRVEKKTSE